MTNSFKYPLDLNIQENILENHWFKKTFLNYQILDAISLFPKEEIQIKYARFFYYIIKDNKKYIHKQSYFQNLTSYDTFSYDDSINTFCKLEDKDNIQELLKTKDTLFNYIRGNHGFLLDTIENKDFFISNLQPGKIIHGLIFKKEFLELEKHYKKAITLEVNPFSSLLSNNLIRTKEGIRLVDFKQLGITKQELELPFLVLLADKKETVYNIFTSKLNRGFDFMPFLINHKIQDKKIKYIYY